jgi:hypothetical protein
VILGNLAVNWIPQYVRHVNLESFLFLGNRFAMNVRLENFLRIQGNLFAASVLRERFLLQMQVILVHFVHLEKMLFLENQFV